MFVKNNHSLVFFILLALLIGLGIFGFFLNREKKVLSSSAGEVLEKGRISSHKTFREKKKEMIDKMIMLDDKDAKFFDKQGISDKKNTENSVMLSSDNIGVDDFQFQKVYDSAKKGGDAQRQLDLLEQLYEKKKSDKLLPYLIKLAVQVRNYDKALLWVSILENEGNLLMIDDTTLFYLLFNGLSLNFKSIERIKSVLLYYHKNKYISDEKFLFYESLITYSRGDMNNYSYFMDKLSKTKYVSRQKKFQENKKIMLAFQDVPEYYLDALTSLEMFSKGYRNIAKVSAKRLIDVDGEYILPRQILLYTSLFLGEYAQAHEASNRLVSHDKENKNLYNFLDAIASFEEKDYANAIIKFKNIHDSYYSGDIKRYLLLSYVSISDNDHVAQILESLLKEKLTPYDFYTTFDIFFYKAIREKEKMNLFEGHFDVALKYIDVCYSSINKESTYICLYGKTGLLLASGEDKKAYQYLQRIIKRYPKGFIYESLGDVAYRLGKIDDAKKWFLKTISFGTQEEKGLLIKKVKKMLER